MNRSGPSGIKACLVGMGQHTIASSCRRLTCEPMAWGWGEMGPEVADNISYIPTSALACVYGWRVAGGTGHKEQEWRRAEHCRLDPWVSHWPGYKALYFLPHPVFYPESGTAWDPRGGDLAAQALGMEVGFLMVAVTWLQGCFLSGSMDKGIPKGRKPVEHHLSEVRTMTLP